MLVDILWVDGQCSVGSFLIALADIRCGPGIIYFVLMFCEYFPPFLYTSLEQITFSRRCPERRSDDRSLGEPVFDYYNELASLMNSSTKHKHTQASISQYA
jgi:hypothetical protein